MTAAQNTHSVLARMDVESDPIGVLDACLALLTPAKPIAPTLIEHITASGRLLKGIILSVRGMTKEDAQVYDKYTFMKRDGLNSGWFIRAEHVGQIPPELLKPNATMPAKPSATDGASRVHTKYGTTVKSSRHLRWLQRNQQHLDRD